MEVFVGADKCQLNLKEGGGRPAVLLYSFDDYYGTYHPCIVDYRHKLLEHNSPGHYLHTSRHCSEILPGTKTDSLIHHLRLDRLTL